jgi:phosphate:Na+ symporter
MFKIFGTVLFLPLLLTGWYEAFIRLIIPGTLNSSNIMFHIAIAHTTFNIINVGIFTLILWPILVRTARMLSFGRGVDVEREAKYLDPLLLHDPPIAMQQTILELVRMLEVGKGTVQDAQEAFFNKDLKKSEEVKEKEDILDELQRSITAYLIQISEKDLDTRESMEYPVLLHSVNDVEKIGDYSRNIADYTETLVSRKLDLPDECLKEIKPMFTKLYELFDNIIHSLKDKDTSEAHLAIAMEDQIDQMKSDCREKYIKRLNRHENNPEAEMMIMDIATNIEKMGDHLISIAKAVLKDLQWGQKTHMQEMALNTAD